MIRKGDIASVIDPSLNGAFKIESVWRVAECAVLSVELRGALRPSMQEVEVAIQDAIQIEKGSRNLRDSCSTSSTFRPSLDQFSSDALELVSNFNSKLVCNLTSYLHRLNLHQ